MSNDDPKLELSRYGQYMNSSSVVRPKTRVMPKLVFLMEVKVGREKVESIRRSIGFEGLFFVDGVNNGGIHIKGTNKETICKSNPLFL